MDPLADFRLLFAYGDYMNRRLLLEAGWLNRAELEAAVNIGPGSLLKALEHIVVGEWTWLLRSQGYWDATWDEADDLDLLNALARTTIQARDSFFATLLPETLDVDQAYRDSSGAMYRATLREQMLQGVIHSTHHRAQAVHLLKRAGGTFVEVDFMYWRRRPA